MPNSNNHNLELHGRAKLLTQQCKMMQQSRENQHVLPPSIYILHKISSDLRHSVCCESEEGRKSDLHYCADSVAISWSLNLCPVSRFIGHISSLSKCPPWWYHAHRKRVHVAEIGSSFNLNIYCFQANKSWPVICSLHSFISRCSSIVRPFRI